MPFAAALSRHPVAPTAVGEVVGQVLDRIGSGPDLALLFISAGCTGVAEDIAGAVRTILDPGVLIGCTTSSVIGGSEEAEDEPAVSLWAASGVDAVPLRSPRLADIPDTATAVVLLADPFSFPSDALLDDLGAAPGLGPPVVGGLASAARGPGGNRLLLDGGVFVDGAVAVGLGGVDVTTVVSQGCRPIGTPMVVTRGGGQIVQELAGRPALERLHELLGTLGPDDLRLVQHGLHLGRVVDEHQVDYRRGDFLVRSLLGADKANGSLAVGDEVEVGDTVQFQVRDADSADEDLRLLLADDAADAEAALLFTCNGRGSHLFGVPDHDATLVAEAVDAPVAGMACAGEIGPVGGRSFLHGFTASVALFREAQGSC